MFEINLSREPKFTRPELLYHPPLPLPMHGVNPRTIMGKAQWDILRRKVFEKNNDCCWACGVHNDNAEPKPRLEAHELYDINYVEGRMELREIVGLCPMCHMYIHRRRLLSLVQKGKRQASLYDAVYAHGQAVLHSKGERAKPWYDPSKINEQIAKSSVKWRDWYLVFMGKKYRSRFKDFDEHARYYARLK